MSNKRKNFYRPKVVMSIHGILSDGKWQDDAKKVITNLGLKSFEYKYGCKIIPWGTQKLVRDFRDWYFNVVKDPISELDISQPYHRPSIIAHSLGSHIVTKALERYPEIKFDKIFLHGAIVPSKFDWYRIILNDQVNSVITEKSSTDMAVRFSWIITGNFFPCCRYGFKQKSTCLKEIDLDKFDHSAFQYDAHYENLLTLHLSQKPMQISFIEGSQRQLNQLERIFRKTRLIDLKVYGNDYEANEVTINKAKEWAQIEPNIWTFMVNTRDNKDILGYFNMIPIDDETYEKFVTGQLAENDIQASNIVPYTSESDVNLIIMSLTLSNKLTENLGLSLTAKPTELLVMKLLDTIFDSRFRVKVNRIAAIGWTEAGKSICKHLGLSRNNLNYMNKPIFEIDLRRRNNEALSKSHPITQWYLNR